MKSASLAGLCALALASSTLSTRAHAAPADTPSTYTEAVQGRVLATSPFADRQDFDFASRGYLGTRADPIIRNVDGKVVWDLSAFDFLKGPAPATVNPSLWRQGQLLARSGLFKVSDRIWQVRGFDIANVTFVKGDTGWIVIDPLTAAETARAALDLVTEKLGKRPITAVIYTHPHADHFGGAGGIITQADADSGKIKVVAPLGFLKAAVTENIIAGVAMSRRATYQFGFYLPHSAEGSVNSGIGLAVSAGTQTLITPNTSIDHTGQELTLDGVRMVFQFTPGTEAPVEMNINFPDWRIIDMAENANATQHNILTPRGAVVRDAKTWADHLTEALTLYGDSDVLITSHGWPRFGRAEIDNYLAKHRDAYAFLHDQTVRLMNSGLNGDEIAASLKLPAALEQAWYDRPYYGSLSFNSRAVYQFYMGWYDANPVHLNPTPPVETGKRYVVAMGGAAHVLQMAQASYNAGDYAWAAELLNREVMADGTDAAAKSLLARAYDQMGWQSENSLWRNIYLTGATELRHGVPAVAGASASQAALVANLPTASLFDLLAVRLNADKVGTQALKLEFVFPDRNEKTYLTVKNGVLIHQPIAAPGPVDATFTVNRSDFLASVLTGASLAAKVAKGEAKVEGDPAALLKLVSWMDKPAPNFPIVTR